DLALLGQVDHCDIAQLLDGKGGDPHGHLVAIGARPLVVLGVAKVARVLVAHRFPRLLRVEPTSRPRACRTGPSPARRLRTCRGSRPPGACPAPPARSAPSPCRWPRPPSEPPCRW